MIFELANPIPPFPPYGVTAQMQDGRYQALHVPDRIVLDCAMLEAHRRGDIREKIASTLLVGDNSVTMTFDNGQAVYVFEQAVSPEEQGKVAPAAWVAPAYFSLARWEPAL